MKPEIGLVTLGARDLERMIAFYRDGASAPLSNHQDHQSGGALGALGVLGVEKGAPAACAELERLARPLIRQPMADAFSRNGRRNLQSALTP
jgi:hypothetical protein